MNINQLKKKIIYRSNYRGSKEMDILLSSFVKSVINTFPKEDLIFLNKLVNLEDETLFKLNKGHQILSLKKNNKVIKMFKKFRL